MATKQRRIALALGGALVVGAGALASAEVAGAAGTSTVRTSFSMVRSSGAVTAGCLNGAGATVHITSSGPVETMTVDASGLPPDSDFDLFVNQLANAPFGVSWYQGDLESDHGGKAHGTFVGRFSVETFAVAPGSGPAPVVHTTPIADASSNPAFAPVHTFHLGVWFNSPTDAAAAGCPATVTPFNGEHNAGVQALSTRQFPTLNGPLHLIRP